MHLSEHKNKGILAKPRIHEAGAPGFICPHCGGAWPVCEEAYQAILQDLKSWDRRFAGPETIAESILSTLTESPLPDRQSCQVSPDSRCHRGPKLGPMPDETAK
jgi:hypothetical protein